MKTLDLPDSARPRPDAARLAVALEELACPGRGAVSLPWLAPAALEPLRRAAGRLRYRSARPQVGEVGSRVHQDFEITLEAPAGGLLWRFAHALEADLASALALLPAPPLSGPLAPLSLNDMAVQRYAAGSRGISPHRDHLRYRGLVVLLSLSGSARLFLCDDRSGAGAEPVSIAPGRLLLMRAPEFAGSDERPFHFLGEVSAPRYGLGLRHDRTKAVA